MEADEDVAAGVVDIEVPRRAGDPAGGLLPAGLGGQRGDGAVGVVKPIWAGLCKNCVGPVAGVSPRERVESAMGSSLPSVIRYPVMAPLAWPLST
ncbi:MAG: hypothetical protein ACRDRS_20685 [Pseudonocardiaceae bacterium]